MGKKFETVLDVADDLANDKIYIRDERGAISAEIPANHLQYIATRIREAHAHERKPGNAAKLRKALVAMLDERCSTCEVPDQLRDAGRTCNWRGNRWSGCTSEAVDLALEALEAPARVCDQLETGRDAKRYLEKHNGRYVEAGFEVDGKRVCDFMQDWFFMETKLEQPCGGT